MRTFIWNDDYLLGICKLDNQHKQLVDLLNAAHLQCHPEAPLTDQHLTLLELVDYAVFHLKFEAKWLLKNFPEAAWGKQPALHPLDHKVMKIQNHYFKLTRNHSQTILSFMTRWATKHLGDNASFAVH